MKTNLLVLNDLLQSESYQIYESETLLNLQYQIINGDPDLAIDQIIECNNHGLFGHSHREFIETWSDYLETLKIWESKYNTKSEKNDFDITLKTYKKIRKEIETCYNYHLNHFTLNDII